MQLKETIEKRSSVRRFLDEPVPQETVKELVRLAGLAPSINNSQNIEYIAVNSKDVLKEMASAVKEKINEMFGHTEDPQKIKSKIEKFSTFFEEAPVVIVVVNKPYTAIVDNLLYDTSFSHEEINNLRNHPNVQSVGAAVQNLLLASVEEGFGACWLTGPLVARKEIEKILKVEEPFTLAAMVAVGKPADKPKQKEKRSVDEILRFVD